MDTYGKQAEYWNRWSDQSWLFCEQYILIMEELLSKLHNWKIPLLACIYEVKECLCDTPVTRPCKYALARAHV